VRPNQAHRARPSQAGVARLLGGSCATLRHSPPIISGAWLIHQPRPPARRQRVDRIQAPHHLAHLRREGGAALALVGEAAVQQPAVAREVERGLEVHLRNRLGAQDPFLEADVIGVGPLHCAGKLDNLSEWAPCDGLEGPFRA